MNNMSDLISREALLEECKNRGYLPWLIKELITNAPAVSGDAVGRVIEVFEHEGKKVGYANIHFDNLNKGDYLFTTPQQPQSVADALEEALTIALEYTQYSHERRQITNRIRALIKRNVPKEGE